MNKALRDWLITLTVNIGIVLIAVGLGILLAYTLGEFRNRFVLEHPIINSTIDKSGFPSIKISNGRIK
jgi:hypothetical protein